MSTRSWLDALRARILRTLNRHERRASGRRGPADRGLKVESLEDRRVLAFVVPPLNHPVGDSPQAIVSGDFNGGGLDLAVANYDSSTVSVLLGNGSGGFGPKADFGTGANPRSLAVGDVSDAVGDVSDDGMLDLVTANAGGDVSILRGIGSGGFAPAVSIPLPAQFESAWGFGDYVAQSPQSVATGDFNGDGLLDLAVTGVTSFNYYYGYFHVEHAYVNVLLSDGSGGFNPTTTSLSSVTTYYWESVTYLPYSIAVGRFDANASDDLAIAHYYDYVDVLLSDGSGNFSSSGYYFAGSYPYSVAAGDVNGDNMPDLVTANIFGNNVSVLLANGGGSFDTAQTYDAGTQPGSVALAKFNGDDFMDLVVDNANDGSVSVLLGTGTGTGIGAFKPPVSVAVGSTPLGLAVGDFNGTGGPDVASANSGSDNVSVLLNNGSWPALDAPSISVNNASVVEGQIGTTAMEFTVTLSADPTQTVTVRYATADSNAIAGSDYLAALGTLTFEPGDPLSQKVNVLVNGDRDVEYSEYLFLRLSDPTNAFLNRATGLGNIIDDEPRVSIDYGPVVVTEGNTGTTNAEFTVRLADEYDVDVTVNLSTVDGDTEFPYDYYAYYYDSATSGDDFLPASDVLLTFAPGETEKSFLIAVKGETLGENDESFFVRLSEPNYGSITSQYAVGLIDDDELRAYIGGGGTVVEGNTMTFTVYLSAAPDASNTPVTVDFATDDGSATAAGGDYVAKTGTVSFGIGETSMPITVQINDDQLAENSEYLYVNLTGANGAILDPYYYSTSGYGYIEDNEPRISINSVSITEGNSGTKSLVFTVTLLAPDGFDDPVTVNYATRNGTATSGSDYVALALGTLTFNPGGLLTQTITVTIKGDKQKEPNEYFYVDLSGASSNALISNSYGIGTILTDDPSNGNGPPPGKGPNK